jgi:hypothetical protein
LTVTAHLPTSALDAVVLAHQGGWDEVLLIAGPILVIMGLLMLAKKRVDRIEQAGGPEQPD